MTVSLELARARFQWTLEVVAKEGIHLSYSWYRLFSEPIDVDWVMALANSPEKAERMEAFISRFGRMQDTIADKLLPRWLQALAEKPGSQIEVLNRAEKLGLLDSTENWLEVRALRNRLVHEYMRDPVVFADDLNLGRQFSHTLVKTYQRMRQDAVERMGFSSENLPAELSSLNHDDLPKTR